MSQPRIQLAATVLGASYARDLARFYQRLLQWEVLTDESDWVMLGHPDSWARLSFQTEQDYVPPVWPSGPGDQQMMVHLDIAVDDLDSGVAWALEAGAVLADHQPQDDVRVMLDPAGHPFCLFPVVFDE